MKLGDLKTVVVGLGVSGVSLVRFLTRGGARVTVTDLAHPSTLAAQIEKIADCGANMELGEHRLDTFDQADLVVLSPGVSHLMEPVRSALRHGATVMGEIELAFRFIHTPIIAVSGTNGKTTVTALTAEMLKYSGMETFVGGNYGTPLIEYAAGSQTADVLVVEISSFQLDTIHLFRPDIGVLLNVTPDHLDRYSDFETYAASKAKLFDNQTEADIAVLNTDDPMVRRIGRRVRSRKLLYPAEAETFGAVFENDGIELNFPADPRSVVRKRRPQTAGPMRIDLSSLKLPGPHNRQNAAAAALAAAAAGATLDGIQQAVNDFTGLSHRMERVGCIDGVCFINDSKATNIDAAAKAIASLSGPLILIMGGRDKKGDFSKLQDLIAARVKKLVVTGEACEGIQAALGAFPAEGCLQATDMAHAVRLAFKSSKPGDTVMLAPACTSFDCYRGYAERGIAFKTAVEKLKKEGA